MIKIMQYTVGSRQFAILLFLAISFSSKSNTVFTVDTMTYTINLDIPENAFLKQLPADILEGYVKGRFHAYYPKREMNEILLDDFLDHYGRANFNCGSNFCWEDYADHPYLQELYDKFKHQVRYKEVIYYDQQHAVVKREIIWLQLMYSDYNYNNELQTINGPKFWMVELYKDKQIKIPNEQNRAGDWSIQQEFDIRHFVPDQAGKEKLKQKSGKMDDANEN